MHAARISAARHPALRRHHITLGRTQALAAALPLMPRKPSATHASIYTVSDVASLPYDDLRKENVRCHIKAVGNKPLLRRTLLKHIETHGTVPADSPPATSPMATSLILPRLLLGSLLLDLVDLATYY